MRQFSHSNRQRVFARGLAAVRRHVATALVVGLVFSGGGPARNARADEPAARKTALLGFHGPKSGALIVEVADETSLGEVRPLSFSDARSSRLEAALKQLLDRNRDGRVDDAEWEARWSALLAADLDQDETLVPLEVAPSLLSDSTSAPPGATKRAFDLETAEGLEAFRSGALKSEPAAIPLKPAVRLTVVREAIPRVTVTPLDPHVEVREFDHGGRFQVTCDDLVIDFWPTLTPPAATTVIPEMLLDAATSMAVQVRPGRRGAFEWFDANRDGLLNRREILAAERPLEFSQADKEQAATVSFTLQIGPAESLRRTSVPLAADEPPPSVGVGPAWFTAMDRNRDGEVSPDEFLGGDPLFRSGDLDQDGRLSAEEARQLAPLDSPR